MNIITFDIEDYFHLLELPRPQMYQIGIIIPRELRK